MWDDGLVAGGGVRNVDLHAADTKVAIEVQGYGRAEVDADVTAVPDTYATDLLRSEAVARSVILFRVVIATLVSITHRYRYPFLEQ
jgi:hypothetical protein